LFTDVVEVNIRVQPVPRRKQMARRRRKLDPRDVPTYTCADVARYLSLPPSTVRAWALGTQYSSGGKTRRFKPVIKRPDSRSNLLSFTNLIEIHVLGAIRRTHRVSLQKVREILRFINDQFPTPHPLARLDWSTDQMDLFVEILGKIFSVTGGTGQIEIRKVVEAYLARVERDERGLATRFYPFTRAEHADRPIADQPKVVVIDPRISFGAPVLIGTGIPTAVLATRFKAGESIRALARDYSCRGELIEEAIRCEQLAA
jgi:uncharacterized protein (DUF433 family)